MHTALTPNVTPANDTRRDDLFVMVAIIAGLDADNDCDNDCDEIVAATVGARCPGGCCGGLVPDPHGPSKHNPSGALLCPFCG